MAVDPHLKIVCSTDGPLWLTFLFQGPPEAQIVPLGKESGTTLKEVDLSGYRAALTQQTCRQTERESEGERERKREEQTKLSGKFNLPSLLYSRPTLQYGLWTGAERYSLFRAARPEVD